MTAHAMIAPLLLPMLAAAAMLLLGERRLRAQAAVGVLACGANLTVAAALLLHVDRGGIPGAVGVYLPANWDVPFGIVLAVDRLSAFMLVLTALIVLGALLFALARWHRAGVHFHPLLQLQLMGLNGAFLTADLFNLFVFFEILLAASYGLMLHGSGRERVTGGLHYIAFNLAASLLFLIGIAVLYGVTGTLNMADIAHRLPHVPAGDRGLLHAGAAILALAFLGKAALWPLGFWLAPAYAAASAPVAGVFVLLSKVGVYAVLRLWTLFFPATAGASALFGADALAWGGLATLAFGAIGVIASQRLGRIAAFSIVVSSGTLLAAIGLAQTALTAGALLYLASSTLATSAMFLLVELAERIRAGTPPLEERAGRADAFGFAPFPTGASGETNLDDDERALVGRAMPAAMAFLGMSFVACALLIAGLPPLTGFIAKFAMLSAVLAPPATAPSLAGWTLVVLVIVSGLLATVSWSRAGMRVFWSPHDGMPPHLRLVECAPIAALLLIGAALVVAAEPALRYTRAAAAGLHDPAPYIAAVLGAQAVPQPTSSLLPERRSPP